MAFGNSDGDLQMLEWTKAGSGPRFSAVIHHTITFEFVTLEQATTAKSKLDAHLSQLKLSLNRYWAN